MAAQLSAAPPTIRVRTHPCGYYGGRFTHLQLKLCIVAACNAIHLGWIGRRRCASFPNRANLHPNRQFGQDCPNHDLNARSEKQASDACPASFHPFIFIRSSCYSLRPPRLPAPAGLPRSPLPRSPRPRKSLCRSIPVGGSCLTCSGVSTACNCCT